LLSGRTKLAAAALFLGAYLFAFALVAWMLASNFVLFVISIVTGGFLFALVSGILVTEVPLLKAEIAPLISFANVFQRIALLQVRWRVEGRINDYRERVDSEVGGLLPHPMELRWIMSKKDVTPYLKKEGPVIIVRMKPHREEAWNLATATLAYVSEGLVPHARRHMRRQLNRAVDFAFCKKLLGDVGETTARNYLITTALDPEINTDETVKQFFQKLDDISEELLTRLFLREIGAVSLGKLTLPDLALEPEITAFLDWAYALAKREPGEEKPELWFDGKNLKVGCVLVAEPRTFVLHGPAPYIRRAREYAYRGADAVYLLARGINTTCAKTVAEEIDRLKIDLVKVPDSDRKYRIRTATGVVDAIAIVYRPSRLEAKEPEPAETKA